MITYKAIIQYFDSIASQHQQIQSFTYGEVNFFDKDKFTEYPALHITPTGTSIDDQVVVYGFDVIIFDRYNVESNKMRNEANCLSDSLMILQDICKEMTDGKYFINQDTLISMELPVTCEPFIDTEPDNCSGWATSFNVITPNEASACLIPYFNPERQIALDYLLPTSVPTNNLVWYSRERIHNQSTFLSSGILNTISPVVDTITGNNTLTLIGDSITWNPQKNAFHVFNQSDTLSLNLRHTLVDVDEFAFFITIKDFSRFSFQDFSNQILYYGNFTTASDGVSVYIFGDDGRLYVETPPGSPDISCPFPIVPFDDNENDWKTAKRRLESFTFCVQVYDTKLRLTYGTGQNDFVEIANLFTLNDAFFGIGHPIQNYKSDFFLQEYIYTTSDMTPADVTNTMIWMNNR